LTSQAESRTGVNLESHIGLIRVKTNFEAEKVGSVAAELDFFRIERDVISVTLVKLISCGENDSCYRINCPYFTNYCAQ
jgi:hypothetical protein